MKRTALILAILLLLGLAASPARAYTNVSFSLGFYDALAPYGTWVHVANYGECWRPRVAVGWRPFTYGHWVYTSYGPTWDGYEPYAWSVYHYGHWVWEAGYGWVWVPGYEWSPAPVSWAYGDGYIGWNPYYGSSAFDANFWIFINANNFGYRNYSGLFLSPVRLRPLFERRVVRVVSGPLRRVQLERIVRRPIRVVPVRERIIDADHHRVRLVVPRDRERTVMSNIARAARVKHATVAQKRMIVKPLAQMRTSKQTHVTQNRHAVVNKKGVNTHAMTKSRSMTKPTRLAKVQTKSHVSHMTKPTRLAKAQTKSHVSHATKPTRLAKVQTKSHVSHSRSVAQVRSHASRQTTMSHAMHVRSQKHPSYAMHRTVHAQHQKAPSRASAKMNERQTRSKPRKVAKANIPH